MKISQQWMSDFVKTDLSVNEISEILTDIGLEVEGTEKTGISKDDLQGFVVGHVISCEKHPNADKLSLTKVDLGNGDIKQIVCGAPNVGAGQKVPVATIGTVLKDDKGGSFKIKKAKLRGEESNGMICSKKELKLSNDHAGIWVMDESLEAGTPLSEVITTDSDYTYEIGLTPNRADAMSHYGVARDLHAALQFRKIPSSFFDVTTDSAPTTGKNPIVVEIQEGELCPRYVGAYIKNITVADSPEWLQKRLRAIGLSPINNVVDATNYVLHSLGQPMHAFDADQITQQKIVVKKAENGSKFSTLDGVERELTGEELMICDGEKAVGMAGVMGGLDSSVTANTKNIFLESAYFNPVSIRKTAKHHGINSDSSFRFERGIDANFSLKALEYAIGLILEIAGGERLGELTDFYPNKIKPFSVGLQLKNISRILGEDIDKQDVIAILNSLDIDIISDNGEQLDLEIPAYRVDVQREIDVIEDILRIYGYNHIKIQNKLTYSIVSDDGFKEQKIEETLAQSLINKGFNEAINISMYKESFNQIFGFDKEQSVELLNSLSQDLSVMRRSLLPGLLQNIDHNIKRKNPSVKLFELGKSYSKENDQYKEDYSLALAVYGNQRAESWTEKQKPVDFYYLKGIVEQILTKFKATNTSIKPLKKDFFAQGIAYQINQKPLVEIAQIAKKTLAKFDIEQPVFYAEFNLKTLINHYLNYTDLKFKPLSKFPEVRRDLALLLDKDKTYQEIKEVVLKTDNKHIQDVNLFDVYEGDKLAQNKKSYAVSILLKDEEKTMNDKQIDAIMQKIIKNLAQRVGAELRN